MDSDNGGTPVPKPRLLAELQDPSDLVDESSNDLSSNIPDEVIGQRRRKKAGLSRLKAKHNKDKDSTPEDDVTSTISETDVPNSNLEMKIFQVGEVDDLGAASEAESVQSFKSTHSAVKPESPTPSITGKKKKGAIARLKERQANQGSSQVSLRSQEVPNLQDMKDVSLVGEDKALSDVEDDNEVALINSSASESNNTTDFKMANIHMANAIDDESEEDDDEKKVADEYERHLNNGVSTSDLAGTSSIPKPQRSDKQPTITPKKSDSTPELRESVKRSKRWEVVRSKMGLDYLGADSVVSATDLHRSVSAMSMNTTVSSGMQSIKISTARHRNFLVGQKQSHTSMMGATELERHFPDRNADIFVCTWNMAEMRTMPTGLDDLMLPSTIEFVPSILVLTSQENDLDRKEWEIALQEMIGPNHVLYYSAQHGSLHMAIFIRRELIWFCSIAEEDNCTVRAFKQIKTKGAVAVSFTMFGTSMIFIGCHFKANEGNEKARVLDYKTINRSLRLPRAVVDNPLQDSSNQVADRFDVVFWAGDMNFRITHERDLVLDMIEAAKKNEHPDFGSLLRHEELTKVMDEELIFENFQEGRIVFPPTYKFDIGTDNYDTSPKYRIPSYTDRVLFKSKKKHDIVCLKYDSVPSMKHSDHKPVYGLYQVKLKPGRDTIPLSGGQFRRDIYIEAAKRRELHRVAANIGSQLSRNPSRICSIM